ncbi:MAG TPA: sigma-70 family RNA polymerase sigma factor [Streptosporangiaceae bacterium]
MSESPAEQDGFANFFAEELPGLLVFLLRQGAGREDAWDAVQESFIRAYLNWQQIDNPRTWIRTTAVRIYRRKVTRDREVPVDMREERHPPPLFTELDQELDHDEECRLVLGLLRGLPVRQREVMAWSYDGYEPHEIAEFIGISDDAVRASLYQARRRLRRHLGERGNRRGTRHV